MICRTGRAAVAVDAHRSQPLLNRVTRVLGVALIVMTGVVFVAHDGSSTSAAAQPAAGPAKAADKVQIKDFLYAPEAVTVAVGTQITFINQDSAPHTATSGPSPNADGVFETGTLAKGGSKGVTVTKTGTLRLLLRDPSVHEGHRDRQVNATASDVLRGLAALALLVVGAVHVQQYADFIADVPTIGVLFLLNGLGAGVVVILLTTRRAALGALGGIAVSAGALISILISMTDNGLFQYTEPAFRSAVIIAIAAEAAAIVLLLAYLATRRTVTPRASTGPNPPSPDAVPARSAGPERSSGSRHHRCGSAAHHPRAARSRGCERGRPGAGAANLIGASMRCGWGSGPSGANQGACAGASGRSAHLRPTRSMPIG